MVKVRSKARFDWLAELAGGLAPGFAAGFSALKLAPSLGVTPGTAMVLSAFGGFSLGFLVMRLVKPAPRGHALAGFAVAPIEAVEEPLLLDVFHVETLADEALLLNDPLPTAEPESRVVQLFAGQPMPTPGQLKERIDWHLAGGLNHQADLPSIPQADASGALYAALDELRRSLR